MNDLPQEILTRIDALAATLGTTVEALWPAMVAAKAAAAIGQALALALTLILLTSAGIALLRMTLRSGREVTEYGGARMEYSEAGIGATACAFVAALLTLFVLIVNADTYAADIIAPEAAAARELLEALK